MKWSRTNKLLSFCINFIFYEVIFTFFLILVWSSTFFLKTENALLKKKQWSRSGINIHNCEGILLTLRRRWTMLTRIKLTDCVRRVLTKTISIVIACLKCPEHSFAAYIPKEDLVQKKLIKQNKHVYRLR